MWNENVLNDFMKDCVDMDDTTVKRKIANCIVASRRTVNPSFRSYWQDTAVKMATKYNVNISEIEKSPEFYNATKISSLH